MRASRAIIIHLLIRSRPFCSPKLTTAKPATTTSTMQMPISAGLASMVLNTSRSGAALHPHQLPGGKLDEVVQHPAGHGGVVHHQQVAACHAEPAVDVPLAAGRLQGLIALHRALAAGAAHGQLHGQNGHAHDDQEHQVEQDEQAAAVLPGQEREPPPRSRCR